MEVSYKNMRFPITFSLTNATLNILWRNLRSKELSQQDNTALVKKEGIHVHKWPFDDGVPPSSRIVDDWLSLVKS